MSSFQLTFDGTTTSPASPIVECGATTWIGAAAVYNQNIAPPETALNSVLVGITGIPNGSAGVGWWSITKMFSRKVTNPVTISSKLPFDDIKNNDGILGVKTDINDIRYYNSLSAGDIDPIDALSNIFQPATISKYYGITGVIYSTISGQIPGLSLPSIESVCEPGKINYTLRNLYNPRDEVMQIVIDRYQLPGYPSFEDKYRVVNDLQLLPGQFITAYSSNYGTVGGPGSIFDLKGNALKISGITDTNIGIIPKDNMFNIIYNQKCLNWTIKYYTIDSSGNPLANQSLTQDVVLQPTNRISEGEQPVYSDYYDGTGSSKIYRYYKIMDKNLSSKIGELYGVIDISSLFLPNVPTIKKNAVINVWFSLKSSGGRWPGSGPDDTRIIKTGWNRNTVSRFIEKDSYFPDTAINWSSLPDTTILQTNHNMNINFTSVATLDPDALDNSFVVVGNIPGTKTKCLMLFTPNCATLNTCTQSGSECISSGLGRRNICSNGRCVDCTSSNTSNCTTEEKCISNICVKNIPCSSNIDCTNRLTPYCNPTLKLCVNCNASSDCPAGQYCNVNTNTCQPSSLVCRSDSDCASTEICNTESGKCETKSTSTSTSNKALIIGVGVFFVLIILFVVLRRKK